MDNKGPPGGPLFPCLSYSRFFRLSIKNALNFSHAKGDPGTSPQIHRFDKSGILNFIMPHRPPVAEAGSVRPYACM